MIAVEKNHVDIVNDLLGKEGIDVNAINRSGILKIRISAIITFRNYAFEFSL